MKHKFAAAILALMLLPLLGCDERAKPTYFSYRLGMPVLVDYYGEWRHRLRGYHITLQEDPGFRPNAEDKPNAHAGLVRSGDIATYVNNIGEDAQYSWLVFEHIVLVVPKQMDDETTEWIWGDYKFVVRKRGVSLRLFGRRYENLYHIVIPPVYTKRGKTSGGTFEFLFNSDVGVVAFGFVPRCDSGRIGHTYWSTEEVGFGAQRRVKQQRPFAIP